jgi:hypothetical protein
MHTTTIRTLIVRVSTLKRRATLAALAILAVASSASATTIATWTFETTPPTANNSATFGPLAADSGLGTASGLHASSATDWTSPVGNGSLQAWSSNRWATGDYYQFQVSSAGLQNVAIDWDQTGSSTSPTSFALEWSTNGTTFNIFAPYSVTLALGTVSNPFWSSTTFHPQYHLHEDLSSIAALNNQAAIYLRLVSQSAATSVNGTDRLDNVSISGTPEPSTMTLLGFGVVGLLSYAWSVRKRRALRVAANRRQAVPMG